ncbi:hypothetical protein GE09DRAFT_229502 [Coniochaeta sp. 2T2.1]|nr:hypothetical protein GE09DRAFT_229502 [Coniochaeta sp. 2T2.1]
MYGPSLALPVIRFRREMERVLRIALQHSRPRPVTPLDLPGFVRPLRCRLAHFAPIPSRSLPRGKIRPLWTSLWLSRQRKKRDALFVLLLSNSASFGFSLQMFLVVPVLVTLPVSAASLSVTNTATRYPTDESLSHSPYRNPDLQAAACQ